MDNFVIKNSGSYFWDSPNPWGINLKVKDWETLKCVTCFKALSEMREDQKWRLKKRTRRISELICDQCDQQEREEEEKPKEKIEREEWGDLKMPHRISDLIQSIKDNPNYPQLDRMQRFQFEGCCSPFYVKNPEDNKWMRQLWSHLYKGAEKPY